MAQANGNESATWEAPFVTHVRAIKWDGVPGAYGVKSRTEIEWAFEVLAREQDTWSDAWGTAYDDVLLGHLWHQYTLYEVSPLAVPLVFELTRQRRLEPAGKLLSFALALFAESVSCERPKEESEYARAVFVYVSSIRGDVAEWNGGPLEVAASRIETFLRASPYAQAAP